MHDKRVLMALSGGVDSTVCVKLLQQKGYAVEGLVIRFSPVHQKAVDAAQKSAEELGIPLTVAECEDLFAKEVIHPFCEAYTHGQTPNPCVLCNPGAKFHILTREADRKGIPAIATGHYARVVEQNGIFHVACAHSTARDQSYMLYRLPQSVLSRLLLPAGEMEKPEIRSIATQSGLSSATAPDSQEICFIPDGDYAAYIQKAGYPNTPGRFIGPGGEDLGAHKGIVHYTVGQRRGLGVALGQPVYVKRIDEQGNVHLCYADGLLARSVELKDVVAADGKPLAAGDYLVKIRSMAKRAPARLEYTPEGTARVVLEQPQRASAPGQHAVLYQSDLVVGGGVITAVYE